MKGRIAHESAITGPMDGREAISMKAYYIVLANIGKCLPLASTIPSDQPILFYKLLLEGVKVEPGPGHQHYLALTRGVAPVDPPPLEDEDLFHTTIN